MKLGVFTASLYSMSLEETLKYLSGLGVQTVELGAGGNPGKGHTKDYLEGKKSVDELKALLSKYNMNISAFSVHGNPVHPQKKIADSANEDFEKAVLFAQKVGVDTVVTFSGCPGDGQGASCSNWVTCPWPTEFSVILDYQWNECLIPYWKKAANFAKSHGVSKIALEMHPGFCVYNTETLLRLRAAVGDEIGANFDPSHLIWQGIDPVAGIRMLAGAIYHFHAKDTRIDKYNTARIGVLDTKRYNDIAGRSWVFRTVGYGTGEQNWREMMAALHTVGYNGSVSIENEDSMMTIKEGIEKAVALLKDCIPSTK